MCPCSPTSADSKNGSIRNNGSGWVWVLQPADSGVGTVAVERASVLSPGTCIGCGLCFSSSSSWTHLLSRALEHLLYAKYWSRQWKKWVDLVSVPFQRTTLWRYDIHAVNLIHLVYIVWWILTEMVLFHWCCTFPFPSLPFPSRLAPRWSKWKQVEFWTFFY